MEQVAFTTAWMAVAAAGIVALIVWAVRHWSRSADYKKGVLGFNEVQRMLKQYSGIRNFKVLSDLTISDGKDTAHADHVLIGFFGVMLLQNVQGIGEYFGDDAIDQWTYIDEKGEKKRIDSPYHASLKAEKVLHHKLAQDGVYKVPIESYVVLSGDPDKTMYNGRKNPNIFTVGGLRKLLSQEKYEKDNDIDVEKLAAYLQGKA